MATKTVVNGDVEILKSVLENSGYFSSVTTGTHGSGLKELICTTENSGLTFRLGGNDTAVYIWNVSAVSGTASYTRSSGNRNDGDDYYPVAIYNCEKGISIVCSRARILITKSNNNKTVVAFGASIPSTQNDYDGAQKTAAVMDSICAIADGDGDTYKFFRNNCSLDTYDRLFEQTLIIPLPTQTGMGIVSYTPNSGLILLPQTRDICNFVYHNKRYFSDGYFAIEDAAS